MQEKEVGTACTTMGVLPVKASQHLAPGPLQQGWLGARALLGALRLLPAVTLGFPVRLSSPSQAPLPAVTPPGAA